MQPVILVTGGSRGIGAAVCRHAAQAGYSVAVNYVNDKEAAHQLVSELTTNGATARAFKADVSRDDDCIKLFSDIKEQMAAPQALVNSAGIDIGYTEVADMDATTIQRLMHINVIGTMLCCREAVRCMSTAQGHQGGAIVNISSMAGTFGGRRGSTAYAASKAAVDAFTKGFAREVGEQGIRVNAVRPGVTLTDMTDGIRQDAALRAGVESSIAMNRVAETDEIAHPVMWLLSNQASFVSGCCLDTSGGGFVIGGTTTQVT